VIYQNNIDNIQQSQWPSPKPSNPLNIFNRLARHISSPHFFIIGAFSSLILFIVVLAFTQNNPDVLTKSANASTISIDQMVLSHEKTASTSINSPKFNTKQGNELLVVFLTSDGPSSSMQSYKSVTGGGLSWSLRARSNTQNGTSEIWQAVAPQALSGAQISAVRSYGSYLGSISVVAFTGANTTANGATSINNGNLVAPSTSITTTANNSWIWGVGNDWDNAIARTVGPGQKIIDQYLASTGDTFWIQQRTSPTPTASTNVLINNPYPATDRWNLAAIEILPAITNSQPPTTPGNLTGTANTPTKASLTWTASSSNIGVSGYNIIRNGVKIATSAVNSYSDTAVSPNTTYTYAVTAYDALGNVSQSSNQISLTTPQLPTQPPPPPPKALSCIPNPHLCNFPDTTNTGVPAGTKLTDSSSITVSTAGTVIDALNVTGTIDVTANNVTIKRTKVSSNAAWPIQVHNGVTGTLIEDSEIDGIGSTGSVGIGYTGFTALRVNIHGAEDGIRLADNVTVQDSWIHNLTTSGGAHSDCFQSTGGSNGIIKHNTCVDADNSAVILKSDQGPISNMAISKNLFNGGNYTVYSLNGGNGVPNNISFTNNQFGRSYTYGISDLEGNPTWSDNTWDDNGQSIPF
jgi:chitodextrinase